MGSLPTRRKQPIRGCLSTRIERRRIFRVLDTPNDGLCGRLSGRALLRADGIVRYCVSPSNVSLSAIVAIPWTQKTMLMGSSLLTTIPSNNMTLKIDWICSSDLTPSNL